ncbi:YidB family protein [Methylobacterium sp. J-092]|uniref:YidB family protein n=1 Tax=Methylobacterium sp. J-092 TaxID=2836667 RepID=UPI001FBC137B|nr:YidB family protein [Methylobacterium sp. J-092]MCJ2009392.1 YidB family protein [Methylobacterium sp. J-092]
MGLLDSIIGSVVGGNANQQQGAGANPLVSVLMSLLAARAGGGGLGGMLGNAGGSGLGGGQGGLGGLLGGGGAGGLGALVEQFTQAGHGGAINSWIGQGQNQPIAPHDLGAALGPETVGQLSQQTGMGSSDLLSQLSHLLPGVIDQLTPQGRMPTEQEHAHW